jgi:hypothetical protein
MCHRGIILASAPKNQIIDISVANSEGVGAY